MPMLNPLRIFPILLCSILLSQRAAAQTTGPAEFDHAAISVRNVDSSAHFYMKLFQFDTIPHPRLEIKYQWLAVGNGQALHMVEVLKDTVSLPFFTHFCFSVPLLEEFAARLDHYNIPYYSGPDMKRGFRTRPDGIKQLFFKDPDKYWVEVNDAKHKTNR